MEAKSGNQFLRKVVKLILDDCSIVGNRDFMKQNHEKILEFIYPKQLEVKQNFSLNNYFNSSSQIL